MKDILNYGLSMEWMNENQALVMLMAVIVFFISNVAVLRWNKGDGDAHIHYIMLTIMSPFTFLMSLLFVAKPLAVIVIISCVVSVFFLCKFLVNFKLIKGEL